MSITFYPSSIPCGITPTTSIVNPATSNASTTASSSSSPTRVSSPSSSSTLTFNANTETKQQEAIKDIWIKALNGNKTREIVLQYSPATTTVGALITQLNTQHPELVTTRNRLISKDPWKPEQLVSFYNPGTESITQYI